MEILHIVLPAFILAIFITVLYEVKLRKPQNKVHFYVSRDNNSNELSLWFGKPCRGVGYWISVGNRVLLAAGDKELSLYKLKKRRLQRP